MNPPWSDAFGVTRNSKIQIPNPKFQNPMPTCRLGFEVWDFFGIWDLDFGIFIPAA